MAPKGGGGRDDPRNDGLPPLKWRPWQFWAKRWGAPGTLSRSTMYERYIPFLRTAIVGGRLMVEDDSALQLEANGFKPPAGAAPAPKHKLRARDRKARPANLRIAK